MNELLGADEKESFTSSDRVHDNFDDMGLKENLLRGIYAYGFEMPSAIQQRGIVPLCQGLDVIQQAPSGTGKTATFCSGILQQLDYDLVECQALVIAPTRELAQQIEKVMRALGDDLGVKVHACVGGKSVHEDKRILAAGVHVVVGTPGRVFDMLRRLSLRPDYIRMFVLDQADQMLSRGFKDQIHDILKLLPPKIQDDYEATIASWFNDEKKHASAIRADPESLRKASGGITKGKVYGASCMDPKILLDVSDTTYESSNAAYGSTFVDQLARVQEEMDRKLAQKDEEIAKLRREIQSQRTNMEELISSQVRSMIQQLGFVPSTSSSPSVPPPPSQ